MRFSVFWSETAPLGPTGRELDFDEKIEIFEIFFFEFTWYVVIIVPNMKAGGHPEPSPRLVNRKNPIISSFTVQFLSRIPVYVCLSIQDAKFEVSLSETQPSGWGLEFTGL